MLTWFSKLRKFIVQVCKDIAGSLRAPKPIFVISIAVLLIAVGQIGIIIPVFPGLVLTIPGLVLLSLYSPTVYTALKRKLSGHPRVESLTDRTRNWLINHIRPRT